MTPPRTYIDRRYTDAGLEAVCDLLNLCDRVGNLDENYAPEKGAV
jgi:hypothetical protein